MRFMTTNNNIFGLLILFLCVGFSTNGQVVINLRNSSFEIEPPPFGNHICCKAPSGWHACGAEDLNTPDVQPGHFRVTLPAASGNYYLGMVTRDNDTWEAVSQRMSDIIEKNKTYTFNLKISYSDALLSQSRRTDELMLYNNPIKVRIWGGRGYCDKAELLDETEVIDHTQWKQYNFRFEPVLSHSFITIEAFYKTPTPIPYNGNVLIDDASPIVEVPEDSEREPAIVDLPGSGLIADIPPPKVVPKPQVKPSNGGSNSDGRNDPKPSPEPSPEEIKPNDKNILDLDRKKMVEGQVIRIESLYFEADSARITSDAYPVLDEIYTFLKSNPDISIEIGGHTNNRCVSTFCNKLSKKEQKQFLVT